MTARASGISANLVIKHEVTNVLTEYLSFCLQQANMRIMCSGEGDIPQTGGVFSGLAFEVTC